MNLANNKRIFAALKAMKDAVEWDLVSEEYATLLAFLPDAIVDELLKRVKLDRDWRPSVSQVLSDALDILDPLPDQYSTWLDIVRMMRSEGRSVGVPAPSGRWRILNPTPEFSHKVVERAIELLGGWTAFTRSGYGDDPLTGMQKRFEHVFALTCREYRTAQKISVDLPVIIAQIAPSGENRMIPAPETQRLAPPPPADADRSTRMLAKIGGIAKSM